MTTTKPGRLTTELETEIRSELPEVPRYIADYLRPLLAEIDALRAERDEALMVVERCRSWAAGVGLRSPPRVRSDIDVLLGILDGRGVRT